MKPVFVRLSFCIYLKQLKMEMSKHLKGPSHNIINGSRGLYTVQRWRSVFIRALRAAKTLNLRYCINTTVKDDLGLFNIAIPHRLVLF
jgi:hypothetical protein